MGKKKPQLLPQVHSEDGSIDVDLARVLQFHYNAAKRIPPFCYSKLPFNFSALSGFEPLLTKLFMVYRQIGWPFPKTWSADVDIALLAVSEVFSRPKNRVCQYTRRIVAKASSIGFNGCLQRGAFVERIPSQILYAELAVDNAHFNLGAKLDRGSLLSPYDWSHPRLAQTDNALVDVFLFRTFLSAVHRALLLQKAFPAVLQKAPPSVFHPSHGSFSGCVSDTRAAVASLF